MIDTFIDNVLMARDLVRNFNILSAQIIIIYGERGVGVRKGNIQTNE